MNLKKLSDQELLGNTKVLVQREREVLSDILNYLREIQARRLYSDLGYSSLFAYCVGSLKYSESQAQRRITAMRVISELPQIEEKVSNGELSLSNIVQAKSFFNQEDKVSIMSPGQKLLILESLKNKSSREGEKLLASQATVPPSPVKERVRYVAENISEVKFAASERLLAKMEKLKGLLAHKRPGMNVGELFDELCNIALEKLNPKGGGIGKKSTKIKASDTSPKKQVHKSPPPAPTVSAGRKYISVQTKRAIWSGANGKCEKCRSQYALEIDHRQPICQGGRSDEKNLRLLCRSCNQREALLKIGRPKMERFLT